ncbi:MAG: hypothetical protein RL318_3046 [Fibrobacterota bacterium]|jgi:uncharacterized protein (TIGR02145 family)
MRIISAMAIAAATICGAQEKVLSGIVRNPDGQPRSGVTIRLASSGAVATTGADGAWSLRDDGLGIATGRTAPSVGTSRLIVENGRLKLSFQGRDAVGRAATAGRALGTMAVLGASRRAASVDTLLYAFGDKVFLRDTVSASRSGFVRTFDTTWNASVIYGWLKDARDGQEYRTVKIGAQVWMAQNLNYKVDSSWWYANSADSGLKLGRLYTWASALGLNDSCITKVCKEQVPARIQGVCPVGWHVPGDAEWGILDTAAGAGYRSGKKLKSVTGWMAGGNGTDEYGFRVLAAGERLEDGTINGARMNGNFWSTSELDYRYALGRYLNYNSTYASPYHTFKFFGYSLRCLKDD